MASEKQPSQYFWKLNLKEFTKTWYNEKKGDLPGEKTVESSGLKQLDVLAYILQNIHPSSNAFIGTYEEIAARTGVSKDTVVRIMRRLGEKDVLRKLQNGVYIVNPYILMWGPEAKRSKIYHSQYREAQRLGRKKNPAED